jgi:hypothetical protein
MENRKDRFHAIEQDLRKTAMFWSTLFLAIPALALASAVWGILRRKWYGVLPLLVVSAAGWQWDSIWSHRAARPFIEACSHPALVNDLMTLLLACGAAAMSLAALWAGWSRVWWFWRALVLFAVPASLVPLEANELILICAVTMPILAAAAWLLRARQDQSIREEESRVPPRQVTLANAFLAFVILGLLANTLRSLLVGHMLLADSGLLGLAGSISGVALAAALPAIWRGSGKKWLIVFLSVALLFGWAYWRWRNWGGDPLGLAIYYYHSRFPAIISVYQWKGEICLLVIVGSICKLHAMAGHYSNTTTTGRLARFALALAILALLAPLAAVYPHMLAPRSSVAPLPPSEAHDTIMRGGIRLLTLKSNNAKRDKYLAAMLELDRALPIPGHVTYDASNLACERLSVSRSMDPQQALWQEMSLEISRALHEGRDADALRLVRLLGRVGQSFKLGGTLDDYHHGFVCQHYATHFVAVMVPTMSDRECREMLQETRTLERAAPDIQTILDFDEYWRNASVGWRDRPQAVVNWLTGSSGERSWKSSSGDNRDWLPRSPHNFRVVQYVLALELYRREQGHLPQTLSAVKAAFDLPELTDPHTDFAPVYRRIEEGYLLYSIGHDGQDDGGRFPTESRPIREPENFDTSLIYDRADLAGHWVRHQQATAPAPAPKPAVAK